MLRSNREPRRAEGFSLPLVRVSMRKRREKLLLGIATTGLLCLTMIALLALPNRTRSGTVTSIAPALPPAAVVKAPDALVAPAHEDNGLNLALVRGFRAIALDVDATSGLEGHALPGSRVDVTLTSNRTGENVTTVLVENARVLSYGGDTRSLEQQRSQVSGLRVAPSISRTITLEVKPIDALQIENARSLGRLGLLMRAPGDIEAVQRTEVSATDVGNKHNQRSPSKRCSNGHATFNGAEIVIGCDGEISRVE